jgi:NAD(P)H-hydrate epimerase
MKVVTSHTMQEIDRQAIDQCGISGLTLMERAGQGCVDAIISEFGPSGRVAVIAGKGNNGGDGYVIARLLRNAGRDVHVFILAEQDQIRGDAAANLARLPVEDITWCPQAGQLPALHMDEISRADVIVDAIFGTGLRSDVAGLYQEAIEIINASGRPVLSVDIPSGIHGTTGRVLGTAVRATVTVAFAFAKLGHVLYPGAEHTNRLIIADIGIPPNLMEAAPGYDLLNDDFIRPMLRRRARQAHKGHFGHCLVVAGSTGKTGAAALAANSAVRAGSGLVTLAVAESLHAILETKTTEVMTVALPDSNSGFVTSSAFPAIEKLLEGKDALALGPGMGRRPGTTALVQTIVESVSLPMVIDADGLNALAEDITILRRKKSADIILTPHPGEMARLLGTSIPDVETIRISVAQEFARNFGVYLILKGARTIVASPDGIAAINGSGNPGMASGGMGDVLTGIIVSLLGQHYSAWDACRIGVYIHGYAANLVADEKGEIGMSASDVQEMLPYAYNRLINAPRRTWRRSVEK